uniref:Cobatoxin n=3 Tax=Spodoptera frugiperda TaxID=7108 RepID=Q6XD77_SPOFR|nr:cobatoxin [Spodoptera frugiperda]AAQ18900.1 cobatoxin long form B [Spodoptera frugiperda]
MKLILFVVCAMVMAAYAVEVISVDDLLRAYDVSHNKIDGESVKMATEALYVPMSLRACTSSACNFVCKFLGYKYGNCVSAETCRCYS